MILVYVDDLLMRGNNQNLIEDSQKNIHKKFKVKDLWQFRYYPGIEMLRSDKEILIN